MAASTKLLQEQAMDAAAALRVVHALATPA
jgi:hypothetical protein